MSIPVTLPMLSWRDLTTPRLQDNVSELLWWKVARFSHTAQRRFCDLPAEEAMRYAAEEGAVRGAAAEREYPPLLSFVCRMLEEAGHEPDEEQVGDRLREAFAAEVLLLLGEEMEGDQVAGLAGIAS